MRTEQNNFQVVLPEMLKLQSEYRAKVRDLHPLQKTYFIQTFGCQLNDHDSETLAGQIEDMGFTPAQSWESADFVVFNTCSIRENADQKFFGHLGRIKNQRDSKKHMLVAVCGCMMKIDEHVEKVKQSYPFVDLMFGPEDIYRLGELMHKRLSGSRKVYDISNEDVIVEGLNVVHERKHRALVTIMYGCNNFCTYCIVPYTRGRERSRQADDIIREIKQLSAEGFSEVMLLGQNVNSFGTDMPKESASRCSFAELLTRICEETDIPWLRFMTSHPKDISLDLLDVMAKYPQIERHLHLPMQSGNDRILKRMNRHYDSAQYLQIVAEAKKRLPDLSITTDIIVGFPGETEEEFADTLRLVEQVAFDSAFTFQYSPRHGTPAALLDEQISEDVMTRRFQALLEIQNNNCLKANQARLGQSFIVLIEGLSDHLEQRFTGRASDFHLINFSISAEQRERLKLADLNELELGMRLEGKFGRVKITEAKTFSLNAELEELYL